MELRAMMFAGLLPDVAPAFALGGEPFARGRFRVLLDGFYAPEVRASRFGARFAFGLSGLSVAGCFDVVSWSRGSLASCAGLTGGVIHAVVFDLRPEAPGERLWVGVLASFRARIRLVHPLVVIAGVEGLALPVRARFHLERAEDVVFEQSIVAVRAYLGLGLSFW